mmetsp:Transcript_2454/g.8931  ORF Transcript_2454/g.8931 Transcript_2454/m.8931 type:complete len:280 (-) Transcript_2454:1332-2171(-)
MAPPSARQVRILLEEALDGVVVQRVRGVCDAEGGVVAELLDEIQIHGHGHLVAEAHGQNVKVALDLRLDKVDGVGVRVAAAGGPNRLGRRRGCVGADVGSVEPLLDGRARGLCGLRAVLSAGVERGAHAPRALWRLEERRLGGLVRGRLVRRARGVVGCAPTRRSAEELLREGLELHVEEHAYGTCRVRVPLVRQLLRRSVQIRAEAREPPREALRRRGPRHGHDARAHERGAPLGRRRRASHNVPYQSREDGIGRKAVKRLAAVLRRDGEADVCVVVT